MFITRATASGIVSRSGTLNTVKIAVASIASQNWAAAIELVSNRLV